MNVQYFLVFNTLSILSLIIDKFVRVLFLNMSPNLTENRIDVEVENANVYVCVSDFQVNSKIKILTCVETKTHTKLVYC